MNKIQRRSFLKLVAVATAALAGCRGEDVDSAAEPTVASPATCSDRDLPGDVPTGEATDLPHLGGAPDSDEGRAIAAFCDTILPGRHRDETGAPGAIDVVYRLRFSIPSCRRRRS